MMYPKAKYTMSYQEFVALWTSTPTYNTFMASITADFGQFAEELKTVLYARWHEYEIAGETVGEQGDFMLQTYYEYRSYYKEMFQTYNKDFNFATDGLKRINVLHTAASSTGTVSDEGSASNSRSGTGSVNDNGTVGVTDEDKSINVDLPNKQISPTDIYAYPSDGSKRNGSSTTTNTNTRGTTESEQGSSTVSNERETANEGTSDSTNTYTDNTKFYDMKERAMKSIRNLYRDFAEKFSDCFIHIF